MDAQKLNNCMEILKKEAGAGLIAGSIACLEDAQVIVGTELSSQEASSLFCDWESKLIKTLADAGFSSTGRFHLLELAGSVMFVCVPMGKYQYAIAVDASKLKLGSFLHLTIPKLVEAFEDALSS